MDRFCVNYRMMYMNVLSVLRNVCIFSFAATTFGFSQGYEISLTFKTGNDTVILGHFFAKSDMLISDDTLILKNGKGAFKGNKDLVKGVYFIYNDKRKFDIVIGDNRKFGITADTTDLINRTRFTSSPENDVFYEFQRYNAERSAEYQKLNGKMKTAVTDDEKTTIRTQMQTLNKERLEYMQKLIDANQGKYVAKFLRALIPPDSNLPEPPKDIDGNVTDREYVYRWYRAHFFDNLNIYDPEMLRTPFYEEKVIEYLTRVIPQYPDTICMEIDKILQKAQADDEIFRCILVSVFNYYVKSNITVHENVWVHIAEKWYIPFAEWSTADYIETLKKEVTKKKPNLIGQSAPLIKMLTILPQEHFKAAALDTAIKFDLYAGQVLQDFRQTLKGKYTAILFWDYSCSHCKQRIEELFNVYQERKGNGLSVITVQTVNSKEAKGKWIDYVNEHDMFGWMNAWAPYDNEWRDLYDVSMTPLLYLLDENGIIIGKRLVPDQIKDLIK